MELSSKVRYALLALLELASHHEQGDFLQIDQIAAEQVWQEATTAAIIVLQRYTLQDLREKRDEGQQLNSMYYI